MLRSFLEIVLIGNVVQDVEDFHDDSVISLSREVSLHTVQLEDDTPVSFQAVSRFVITSSFLTTYYLCAIGACSRVDIEVGNEAALQEQTRVHYHV